MWSSLSSLLESLLLELMLTTFRGAERRVLGRLYGLRGL